MSKIKIETITAVHVGSGQTLQYGNDFVNGIETVEGENYPIIGIVDPRKVLEIIGEQNIDKWVRAIEKGISTSDIVRQFAPAANIESYSQRTISPWSSVKNNDTLKEHIHDGMGKPYIPGSSIKGAIRTAVLASLTSTITKIEDKINFKKNVNRNGNIIYSANAKTIESDVFGNDPNSDIFRFLQVGDAIFGDNYEIAIRMVNINERERQNFWDTSKPQLIEAICPEDETTFQLNLKSDTYKFAQGKVHSMPACMQSISTLFQTINEHTKLLVNQEINYWDERNKKDDSGKVDDYLKQMKTIRSIIESCTNGKSCILRIGHGSGWRFITGAWTETFSNFYDEVVPVSRPRNNNYINYDFPKTRRVDEECKLLGFVKLSQE